jgi:preprotein translocase subunit SecG
MLVATLVGNLFLGLFITLFVIVSVLLILLILIQKGRGGGLASAFGGGGGNTAFGSKTGDVLTWATSIIFGVFLLLAVILNLMTRSGTRPTAAGNLPTGTPVQMPQQSSRPQPPRDTTPSVPAPTIPLDHPSTPAATK